MKTYVLIFIFVAFSSEVSSSIYNYVYPNYNPSISNYGTTGLIQNPSARFFDEGTLSLSWTHNDPYLRGSIIANPFNWFEASFQYTDINNLLYSEVREFSGSQSAKDKSFDFKFKLLSETPNLPQIALGLRDFGGTGSFASEYLVFSKFLSREIDFSAGIGWGTLSGNSISNPLKKLSDRFNSRVPSDSLGGRISYDSFFSGDAGYFWGIEWFLPNRNGLRMKIEYDGTNYVTEGPEPLVQDSKFNIGLVHQYSKDLQLKFSYTRGNNLNFGFSYSLSLGKSNPRKINKVKPKIIDNSDIVKRVTAKSDRNLYRASLLYLRENDFSLQKAQINDDESTYHVVISQSSYQNPALASGRALGLLDQITPDNITNLKVSEVNGGLGLYSVEIDRDSLRRYRYLGSTDALLDSVTLEPFKFNEREFTYQPKINYPAIFYSLAPELQSQIGGPDGFFFGDLKLSLNSEILFLRNLSLLSNFKYGIYDNMDNLKLPSNSVLPHVRTEIVQYLKQSREFSIQRLQLNYYKQLSDSIFFKMAGGILESMFSGVGFELLYRPYNSSYGIGVDLWDVKQRDYDQMLDHLKYETLTGHLSLYYQEPNSNILFKIMAGRYLAKDSGFTFDFSREFNSGLRVGAFFHLLI